MAAILAARKLCQLESTRPSPALHSIIADAVIFAEWIMQRMQKKSPVALIGAQPWGGQGFCLRVGWGGIILRPYCLCKTRPYCANLRWL